MSKDKIFENSEGFGCVVEGRTFGLWRSRGEAKAGLKTEQRRAKKIRETKAPVPVASSISPSFKESP